MALGKQSEPVRIYSDDDARLPMRLSKVLRDRIEALSEAVLNGQLTEREYRFSTGRIAGLREALSEAEQIGKDLNGE